MSSPSKSGVLLVRIIPDGRVGDKTVPVFYSPVPLEREMSTTGPCLPLCGPPANSVGPTGPQGIAGRIGPAGFQVSEQGDKTLIRFRYGPLAPLDRQPRDPMDHKELKDLKAFKFDCLLNFLILKGDQGPEGMVGPNGYQGAQVALFLQIV